MIAPRTSRRLAVTSPLAIATALLVGKVPAAHAQSFNGTGTVVAGSASISTGSGTTDISGISSSAVIDWAPTDTGGGTTPILFQNSGTTATFSSLGDFSVLNRILPTTATRAVQFDGTVLARIGGASPTPGGTVYFYSPGGIIASGSSVFDVGNLGLTSSPVAFNAVTGEFDAADLVSFQAANAGSQVNVLAGANIDATGYVAIVSPVVNNAGSINLTAGSGSGAVAALVAANAADITFSPDGIFNITVTQGTAATGTVLSNSGSITGLAGSGIAASHRVYMVAIPQNQAITMAIASGSTLGFDIAAAADIQGNAVVLSGGYNVAAGEAVIAPGGPVGKVDITLNNSAVTSRLTMTTSGQGTINAINGTTSLASDVTVNSVDRSSLNAQGVNANLSIAGSARVIAIDPHALIGAGAGAIGGLATVFASSSGAIDVSGNLSVGADTTGGDAATGTTGSGTGGTAQVQAQTGGSVHVGIDLTVGAEGVAGASLGANVSSGNATGGNVGVFANGGNATITVDGSLYSSAAATTAIATGTGAPALGVGGNIDIIASGAASSSTGNAITVTGSLFGGTEGIGNIGFSGGSNGRGGQIAVIGDTGGAVSIGGISQLNAGGFGGDVAGVGPAGNGDGGTVNISANTGGTVSFGDQVFEFFHGSGGSAVSIPVLTGANGGIGRGGQGGINAGGGTITLNAGATIDGTGFGGDGARGGNGVGGNSIVQAFNGGTLTVTDFDFGTQVLADGVAGVALASGGAAGNSFGGNAQIVATGGGTIDITSLFLNVFARGLRSTTTGAAGSDSGVGFGGTASISQGSLGSVDITSGVTVDTLGEGGHNYGGGSLVGGTGRGGNSRITVNDATGLTITGTAIVGADGDGGDGAASVGTSSGGTGTGGVANIGATLGPNAISGAIFVHATAEGGSALLNGNGGVATGGQAIVGVIPGASAGSISFGDVSNGSIITSEAKGGNASGSGNAGNATGGTAQLFATGGNVTVAGALDIDALAEGGSAVNGVAGTGIGGFASVLVDNSVLVLGGDILLGAQGIGGQALGNLAGAAGQGGTASIVVQNSGTATFSGQALVYSTGLGGNSLNLGGVGGNGTGGNSVTRVLSGGDITFQSLALLDSSGLGGNADLTGGNGIGGNARIGVGINDLTDGGGGTITLSNNTQVFSTGIGGDAGFSGDGFGGNAAVVAWNGQIFTSSPATLTISADGFGGFGNGSTSSDGGDGTGGAVRVFSGNSLNGLSRITLSTVFASAEGQGGLGALGVTPGATGGLGGNGTGGSIIVTAGAGNGNLSVPTIFATASGTGGTGGDGSDNLSGTAGTGGTGGNATGGSIQIGSESATATPLSAGSAGFGTISMDAAAFGGTGGNGGQDGAGAVTGNGGSGGDAFGGAAILLVRGTPVNITGTTTLSANANGGDAGTGVIDGLGGDATIGGNGGIGITVTNRFQVPTQRGQLTASILLGAANAVAGSGSTNGQAIVGDSPLSFTVTNADAIIGGVDVSANASTTQTNALPSTIDISGGTVNVSSRFGFATAGDLSLTIDNGFLVANTVDIFANDWILGSTVPANIGVLTGSSSLSLASSNNLVAYATISSSSSINLNAGGAIQFGDLVSGGSLFAQGSGPITLGAVSAAGTIDLLSGGNINTLGATAGGYLNYESLGAVSTGALTSGEYIEVDSLGGPATVGNVQAGDYFTLQANGAVSVGNVTAGIVNPSADPLATYTVGIAGNGNVTVGTVQAVNDIGLLANTGSVTAGALTGRDMLLLADTGVTVNGGITASGRLGIAKSALAVLGGAFDTFDKEPVFAALPSAVDQNSAATFGIAGPIALNGTVQAQSLKAFTSGNLTASGTVTTTNSLEIAAGGNFSSGALSDPIRVVVNTGGTLSTNGGTVTGGAVNLTSTGAMGLGAISSNRFVILNSQASVTTANINAADRVFIGAQGNVTAGNIVSDPLPFNAGSLANTVHIGSGGSITVGNIRSVQSTTLAATQNITVGQINSAQDVALLPGQSLTSGSILAGIVINPATGALTGANGRVLIGNPSMLQAAGNLFNLDYNALFNAVPARIGGSVLMNGGVGAALFRSYSQGAFSAGGIQTFNFTLVDSGGLVTVRQRWSSPDIEIRSDDIDIQQAAASPTNPNPPSGLSAGTTGQITLLSTNAAPALIGDGLSGSGYSLSQAEFGRITGGSVLIGAQDQTANLVDMLIGNLAITGALAGNTIANPIGSVVFVTGNIATQTPSGGIRITGNLTGQGFTTTNSIEFQTDLFELDAATGSIDITDASNLLSGTILIEADHIHIAEGAILTKLEADPFYSGHVADINRPAAVSRPDGVFNAAALDLFPGKTLYIQNTGTALTPAGFYAGPNVDVTPPDVPPTGGIEVIINGQFDTSTGVLTGKQAYDALIAAQPDFTGFSAQSQLNSCLFIGGCVSAEDPVASISSEIEMISDSDLSDSPVVEDDPDEANAEEQSDEEKAAEEDVDGSPIAPPAPLIDTRPLNPPVTVTEPVAGSGNPALIGSAVNESIAQGEGK